jgi:hypothetical protein
MTADEKYAAALQAAIRFSRLPLYLRRSDRQTHRSTEGAKLSYEAVIGGDASAITPVRGSHGRVGGACHHRL